MKDFGCDPDLVKGAEKLPALLGGNMVSYTWVSLLVMTILDVVLQDH